MFQTFLFFFSHLFTYQPARFVQWQTELPTAVRQSIVNPKRWVKESEQSLAYVGLLGFPELLFLECNTNRCLRDTVVPPRAERVGKGWLHDPRSWLATPSFSLGQRSPCVFSHTIQVQAVKRPRAACAALSVCFAMIISSPNSLYVLHYPYRRGPRTAAWF